MGSRADWIILVICLGIIAETNSFQVVPIKSLKSSPPFLWSRARTTSTIIDRSVESPHSPSSALHAVESEVSLAESSNFFTITGFIYGLLLCFGMGIGRNAKINNAWEERLREAQAQSIRDNPNDTRNELDLRAEVAVMSSSMYGREAMEKRESRRLMKDDYDYEYDEGYGDNDLTEKEIAEFEKNFKIKYDPYYDQPYYEDELPNNVEFSRDPYFGDRAYRNGEFFFFSEGLYYRLGCKPVEPKLFSWQRDGKKRQQKRRRR